MKHKYRLDVYRTSPTLVPVGNGAVVPIGGGDTRIRWVLDGTEVRVAERSAPYLVDFTCVPAQPPQKAIETVNLITKTVEWQWRWPHPRFWAHQPTGVFSLEGRERVVRAALWRSRPFGFITVPAVAAAVWLLWKAVW